MKIQAAFPDGMEIGFYKRNLIVPKSELYSKGKNILIAIQLFVTSEYYSTEIEKRLGIRARVLVEDWGKDKENLFREAKENNIKPFDFPEIAAFPNKKKL